VVLALLIATGLFAGDDGEQGPLAHLTGAWLADAFGEVHEGLNAVLWVLVGVHIAAVVRISFFSGDNLIRAMWTGRKENTVGGDIPATSILGVTLSVAIGVAAVLAVVW